MTFPPNPPGSRDYFIPIYRCGNRGPAHPVVWPGLGPWLAGLWNPRPPCRLCTHRRLPSLLEQSFPSQRPLHGGGCRRAPQRTDAWAGGAGQGEHTGQTSPRGAGDRHPLTHGAHGPLTARSRSRSTDRELNRAEPSPGGRALRPQRASRKPALGSPTAWNVPFLCLSER